jgi:hypothetical protein
MAKSQAMEPVDPSMATLVQVFLKIRRMEMKNNDHVSASVVQGKNLFKLCVFIIPLVIAACSPSTGTPVPTAAIAPTATDVMPSLPPSAASLQLDPCQLIDKEEASALAGASFGDGVESSPSGESRICTYGANTKNVFMVEVAQAKDVATAQAYKASFLSDIQSGVQQFGEIKPNITQLPNFADGGVMADFSASLGGSTLSGRALGFLKGVTFFSFSDLVADAPAPTSEAAQAEAQTVLARLP